MEAGLDTGPILLREAMPIGPDATTGDLHGDLSNLGAQLIVKALEHLDTLTPEPQPETGITYGLFSDGGTETSVRRRRCARV